MGLQELSWPSLVTALQMYLNIYGEEKTRITSSWEKNTFLVRWTASSFLWSCWCIIYRTVENKARISHTNPFQTRFFKKYHQLQVRQSIQELEGVSRAYLCSTPCYHRHFRAECCLKKHTAHYRQWWLFCYWTVEIHSWWCCYEKIKRIMNDDGKENYPKWNKLRICLHVHRSIGWSEFAKLNQRMNGW